jgi:hypothetical protein
MVWDNAVNGHRGRCASQVEANALAADLELQYTVHGQRDPTLVRRLAQPVTVDTWNRRAGELDAWINEGGRWIGRVRLSDGQFLWLDEGEIRPAEHGQQAAGGHANEGRS